MKINITDTCSNKPQPLIYHQFHFGQAHIEWLQIVAYITAFSFIVHLVLLMEHILKVVPFKVFALTV